MIYIDKNGNSKKIVYILKVYTDVIKYFATAKTAFEGKELERTMEIPTGLSQKISPQQFKATIGSMNCTVYNEKETVSQWVYSNDLYKCKAQIFIQEGSFEQIIYTGNIRKIDNDEFETYYKFEISDIQDELRKPVFQRELANNDSLVQLLEVPELLETFGVVIKVFAEGDSNISDPGLNFNSGTSVTSGSFTLNSKTITVDSDDSINSVIDKINESGANIVASFNEDTDIFRIEVDKVDLETAIIVGNSDTSSFLDEVGLGDKLGQTLTTGSPEKVVFQGHPFDFALGVLEQNLRENYTSYINENSFDKTNELYSDILDLELYFEFKEVLKDPLSFLQKEIFPILNVFPVIDRNGKLNLMKQQQPESLKVSVSDVSIFEEDIIKVKKVSNDYSNIVNNIWIYYNYDYEESEFLNQDFFVDVDSYKQYGPLPKEGLKIELRGVNNLSQVERESLFVKIKNKVFDRYSDYSKVIELDIFHSSDKFKVGDYVFLEHSKIMNWKGENAGERGLTIDESVSVDCVIDRDQWGNYTGEETDDELGYLLSENIKVIEVGQTVTMDFFDSIKANHSDSESFFQFHGR